MLLQKLLRLASGTPVINDASQGTSFLRKAIVCRRCGLEATLTGFINPHPRGVRGHYVCPSLHNIALRRDGVTRMTHQTDDRVYFA